MQRKQLADAVATEREAAERAEALRFEVAALEEEAMRKEAEAVLTQHQRAKYVKMQKVVEADRYVEAYRKQLQQEAAMRTRPLPPLCICGLDPLIIRTRSS